MAGNYQKNRKKFNNAEEWLNWAYIEKQSGKPICTELEHFTNVTLSKSLVLEKSLELFINIVELAIKKNILYEVTPFMCIPLKFSREIIIYNPDKFNLIEELDLEPPGIYLLTADERIEPHRHIMYAEEYCFYGKISLPLITDTKYKILYRCSRKHLEYKRLLLEFERGIYIEYDNK